MQRKYVCVLGVYLQALVARMGEEDGRHECTVGAWAREAL